MRAVADPKQAQNPRPGESRDPPFSLRDGGYVGPGFRRDAGLVSGSGLRLGFGEEGEFLRRRGAAEDRVAVREAAEALDDIDVGHPIPPVLAVLRIASNRQTCD